MASCYLLTCLSNWNKGPGRALGPLFCYVANVLRKRENVDSSLKARIMARHLLEVQAKTRLSLGKSIAQFLSAQQEADYTILKWLSISKGGDEKEYSVYYSEVIGEDDENELDIVEFTPLDPDEYPYITEFDTVEEALAFATTAYGASVHEYVAESMIGEEYAHYLKARRGKGD